MSRSGLIHFVFVCATVMLFTSCNRPAKNNNQQKKTQQYTPNVPEGWQALFDANTLENWKITSFGTEGPVKVSGGSIIINYGDGCSGITWTDTFPKVNYEIQLEARKMVGNDFFCGMTFPVNDDFCSLIVGGWGGPVVGLSSVDGQDASDNETQVLKYFEKEVWYNIHLRVTETSIQAWIDDEKLVDLNYTDHELSIRPEVALSKPFGICTWMTTAELRNIAMRKLESVQ
ncbi:3-keto-disaccharide hydrolase [Draconibacterium halophilum]|uniref:DUF1080 domain-containing protein n=1 Tax=Draconibacterium halophilum TaxID=2706887 RepID=A0A6C0RC36_9BACT|nr:DUF1080 domain-containing protein [Draconibacterium halophilum]QIA07890.1 DUF1080 domain-containing protein [Draconibacterium halophilum]